MTELTQCSAMRRDGSRCTAWAVLGSDPPRCSVHAQAAAAAAEPRAFSPEARAWLGLDDDPSPCISIETVIADLYERQMWINELIDSLVGPDGASVTELARLLSIHGANAARLGRLLRDRRALSGDAADGISGAIAQALDELSTELGLDL